MLMQVDMSYLSPLFISYDAQLKEKDEIIKEMKNQGYRVRNRH